MSVFRTPPFGTRRILPASGRVVSGPRLSPPSLTPGQLLNQVRAGGQLLFTRNTGLAEITYLLKNKALGRPSRDPLLGRPTIDTLFFRHGLGHEYGEIVIVMRREFYSLEKGRSNLNNLWLQNLIIGRRHLIGKHLEERGGIIYQAPERIGEEEAEEILRDLTRRVEYNHEIPIREYASDRDHPSPDIGHTCNKGKEAAYSGNAPQLEVTHSVPISMIERILVPEHLAGEVRKLLLDQPDEIRDLFLVVEGTGKTEKDFLAGRENLRRRSRYGGGGYHPRFGDRSFYLFELAYYQLVINSTPLSYKQKMVAIAERYGFHAFNQRAAWIDLFPPTGEIKRNKEDWCIFIQPKANEMIEVFEIVLQVLQGKGITLKVPADLEQTWREGRTFGSPGSPKIKLYLNQETLRPIMLELAKALEEAGISGDGVGPSFTRAYGEGGLLYYKKEHFSANGTDLRAVIANNGADQEEKSKKLAEAGFRGENFYLGPGDVDPLEEERVNQELVVLIAKARSQKMGLDEIRRLNEWTKRVMEGSPSPKTKLLVLELLKLLKTLLDTPRQQ